MLYRILNKITKSRVDKIRPVGVSFLTRDLKQQEDLLEKIKEGKDQAVGLTHGSDTTRVTDTIKTIEDRIKIDRQYIALLKYFSSDQKRLYMMNRNYLNFLKAIIFLYKTSQASVSVGVLTAPAEVYHTINAVQDSFKELTKSLPLENN